MGTAALGVSAMPLGALRDARAVTSAPRAMTVHAYTLYILTVDYR